MSCLRLKPLVAFAIAVSGLLPGAAAAASGPPAPVSLSAGWQFRPDPQDRGLAAHWERGGAGAGWRAVSVPHVFDTRPLPQLFGGTTGWYRTTFRAPSAAAGFAWAVHFEQVRRTARVWLNGREIGTHSDPYAPFDLALTGLQRDGSNTLVVRVDNHKAKEPREGWWNWGGITREVRLVARGEIGVEGLGVMSDLECSAPGRCTGGFLVDGEVVNRTTRTLAGEVRVSLRSPSGAPVPGRSIDVAGLAPGERRRVHFRVPVKSPVLWAPESPRLYRAEVTESAGGKVWQRDEKAVGLRSVAVRKGQLLLNGRRVELSGASIQEDVRGKGPVLSPADMDGIVSKLKALHANATRAHYLLTEGLLDRFDRAGILVWSQAPIYHRDRLLETPADRATAVATLRAAVLGARSHPSVITHSVANELSVVPDRTPTHIYLEEAAALTKDLDPTIPTALDVLSYPGFPRQNAYGPFQLLGINNYFGWYPGKPTHPTIRLMDMVPFLRTTHERYPDKALVVTEFGAEANQGGPVSSKQTYAFQADYVKRVLGIVSRMKFVSGSIYWTLQEFAVKPNWNGGALPDDTPGLDSIHNKGLISYAGTRKPAWQVAQRIFASTPLYPGAPSIRPPSGAPVRAPGPTTAPLGTSTGGAMTWLLALLFLFGVTALAAYDVWAYRTIRRGLLTGRRRQVHPGRAAPERSAS
jgi:Glycosyl hydrolases family 2, TIM barrel domain/Glycosyl hydrolases family 2, sugar binding domain/Glycosyl hydrolases family 2